MNEIGNALVVPVGEPGSESVLRTALEVSNYKLP
jgi:hypothetical protein